MEATIEWKFNPETSHITHRSGVSLKIDGRAGAVNNISPIVIPATISAIELAKLIREAVEYYGKQISPVSLENPRPFEAELFDTFATE